MTRRAPWTRATPEAADAPGERPRGRRVGPALVALGLVAAGVASALRPAAVVAQDGDRAAPGPAVPAPAAGAPGGGAPRLHPPVVLRDHAGLPVVESGAPASPVRSCDGCHDAAWIAEHGYHARAGHGEPTPAGARPWDRGPGLLGRWDPLTYGPLASAGVEAGDLDLAAWLRAQGRRHVGGGPLAAGPGSRPRAAGSEVRPHAAGGAPAGGWDWAASGTTETDCFLCHLAAPDVTARAAALAEGAFAWAATATLARTGLVEPAAARAGESAAGQASAPEPTGPRWRWRVAAFEPGGAAPAAALGLGRPRDVACGACHGPVHAGGAPLRLDWDLAAPGGHDLHTKGQPFSAQRIADAALDLAGKDALERPWDVHAARLVGCATCHAAPNAPGAPRAPDPAAPEHLAQDPRRLDAGDFLRRPGHDLLKGRTAQGTVARDAGGGLRTCADCHDPRAPHASWLPYLERHLERLACEACHVPRVHVPARRQTDWTLLTGAGEPVVAWRGLGGGPTAAPDDPAARFEGWTPALVPRDDGAGPRLVPHNLITTWLWVAGDPPRPVPLERLRAALLVGGAAGAAGDLPSGSGRPGRHHPEVVAALDRDGDGRLDVGELRLDRPEAVAAVRARLAAVGVPDARVVGEVQPVGLHHGVVEGARAERDCRACHGPAGRLAAAFPLATHVPPGAATPALVGDAAGVSREAARIEGAFAPAGDTTAPDAGAAASAGGLAYRTPTRALGWHVVGLDRVPWVDRLGALALALAALGALGHGALRWATAARRRPPAREGDR